VSAESGRDSHSCRRADFCGLNSGMTASTGRLPAIAPDFPFILLSRALCSRDEHNIMSVSQKTWHHDAAEHHALTCFQLFQIKV